MNTKKNNRIPLPFGKIFIWAFVLMGTFISVFPFYWLVVMSTNSNNDFAKFPPKLTLGTNFTVNFNNVLSNIPFFDSIMNTLYVSIVITIASVFFCSLAGFTFAKFDFPFKKALFYGMLATMMIPAQLSIVPRFIIMQKLSWVNTYYALIIPSLATAFGVFWMTSYAEGSIHDDLLNAGRIDGCRTFRLFFNIGFPLLRPGVAFLAIFTFMNSWNDYMWPLIVINNQRKQVIQVTLSQLKSLFSTDYAMVMSGTLMGVLPLIIIYIIFSRQFIANIAAGGVKD